MWRILSQTEIVALMVCLSEQRNVSRLVGGYETLITCESRVEYLYLLALRVFQSFGTFKFETGKTKIGIGALK